MIIEAVQAKLRAMEADAAIDTRQAALTALRELGSLEDPFQYYVFLQHAKS